VRAQAQFDDAGALLARLSALLAAPADPAAGDDAADLLLWLLPESGLARGPRGDVLVPVLAGSADLARTQSALERVARAAAQRGETRAFRLLFLGMDQGPAATLAHRMALRAGRAGGDGAAAAVVPAGAAQVARDLMPVVRAAAGWSLATMARARA
jgi:hypothetical protein